MPTVYLSPGPFGAGGQFFDANGVPLNAGRIATFAAGTTTPTATYTTAAGTIQNANPVILSSDGRPPQEIWLLAATGYQFQLVDSVSNLIGTYPGLYGIGDPASNNNIGYTGATISGALIMNLAPINEAQGANIPVAAQINLTTTTGNYLSLTGSGTVTAIQLSQGAYRELVVNTSSSAFVNSATMALLGGQSFTPAVGDILGFRGEAAPVVRQVLYSRANGLPVTVTPISVKVVSTTFDMASATGTFQVTGIPFRPVLVNMATAFPAHQPYGSVGASDGTTDWCNSQSGVTAGWVQNITSIAAVLQLTTNVQTFSIANGGSLNVDGCTLRNVKTGTPTGILNMSFTFQR